MPETFPKEIRPAIEDGVKLEFVPDSGLAEALNTTELELERLEQTGQIQENALKKFRESVKQMESIGDEKKRVEEQRALLRAYQNFLRNLFDQMEGK